MALTKKQLKQLTGILSNVERAYKFLQSPEVKGIAHEISGKQSNGATYTINNSEALEFCANSAQYIRVSDKNIGSDIAGLSFALSGLRNFIESNLD